MSAIKILASTVIGGGLIAGYRYYKNLKAAGERIEYITHVKKAQASFKDGITVELNINIKNPTAASFSIQYPVTKIMYNNSVLAHSKVINQLIKIPANGEAWVRDMQLTVTKESFPSVLGILFQVITGSKEINLTILTTSAVHLGWTTKDTEQKKTITIPVRQ